MTRCARLRMRTPRTARTPIAVDTAQPAAHTHKGCARCACVYRRAHLFCAPHRATASRVTTIMQTHKGGNRATSTRLGTFMQSDKSTRFGDLGTFDESVKGGRFGERLTPTNAAPAKSNGHIITFDFRQASK